MNMIHTVDVEAKHSDSTFVLVDVSNQPESAKHGARIGEEYIEALFGRDYINELQATIKEGEGEAGYIKGGRFSQIANFTLIKIGNVKKVALGDIDTKLVGVKTVAALREKFPNRELRNQIAKYTLKDGQEVEFQDGEKVLKDTRLAVNDAIKQIERISKPITKKQEIINFHAKKLQELLSKDPEAVLLSNGLNRAKETAIKVLNVGGKLEYYLCDPINSLGDPKIFDREKHLSDRVSASIGTSLLVARSLPNISKLSIHRLVMEMTTEFGHFDSESPIVMATLPLVLNIIQSEILEQIVFAADGFVRRKSVDTPPMRCRVNRALESFSLMKNFVSLVGKTPNYSDIKDEHIQEKVGLANFSEFNNSIIVQKLVEALEMDAPVTLFYIFSYFPTLATSLFPEIDKLNEIQRYHEVYDEIDQNMLDMYIRFDTEGRNSSYIKSHLQELNFLRNLQEICYQVFPYGDKPPLDKGESGPKIIAQLNPTPSVAKVMAVLLLAAGKSSPDDQLLVRIASDWEHVEAQVNGKADERIQMDCVVTPEKIKAELAGLADLGVGVPN